MCNQKCIINVYTNIRFSLLYSCSRLKSVIKHTIKKKIKKSTYIVVIVNVYCDKSARNVIYRNKILKSRTRFTPRVTIVGGMSQRRF